MKDQKLDKRIMEKFGFKELWPNGNPKEQWWENKELDISFFGMPTAREFIKEIYKIGKAKAREQIKDKIDEFKNLLNL